MPSLRRLLLLASVLTALSPRGPLHAQTITFTDTETKTDPLTAGTPTILTIATGSATQSGVISGTGGSIDKQGGGNLTISASNTFTGGTTITAGSLIGSTNSAFGTGGITLAGGNLMLTGGLTVSNALTVNSAGNIGSSESGQVNYYTGNVALNLSGGDLTLNATGTERVHFSGLFSGTGNVAVSGNNNGAPGSTNGRVLMDYAGNQTFTGNLTINSGGLLQTASDHANSTVTVNGSLWLTSDGGNSRTVNLGALAGSGAIRVILNDGQAANLQVGSNNASTTFSGVIARTYNGDNDNGVIGLTKVGTGTLTLTGANTFSNGTTISAGTLLANNTSGSALGTGNVTVSSGATFGGNGSIGALTTISSGGILAPGASVGTLTFTSGLTLNTGSILNFDLGTTSDLIRVSGATLTGPTGTGGVTLNFSDSGGFTAGTYTLINYTSATLSDFQSTDFALGTTVSGYSYNLSLAGNSLQLTASAIPEPSTYAAIFGAVVLGFAAYRRRHKK